MQKAPPPLGAEKRVERAVGGLLVGQLAAEGRAVEVLERRRRRQPLLADVDLLELEEVEASEGLVAVPQPR